MQHQGICAGGNWIVDHVKTVNRLPKPGMLATILSETTSSGGSPANVLADLARFEVGLPLSGWGMVGDDADGNGLRSSFDAMGVDMRGLRKTREAPTAYTDVMNDASARERMFFHHRGANAYFAPEHVDIDKLDCRIFHLGYLLLLDAMDACNQEYGTEAARLLAALRKAGIRTSVDVVSEEGDRFAKLVPPALRHTDYLILNEIEAGNVVNVPPRHPDGRLNARALRTILERISGLGPMRCVVVHMAEGAVWWTREGEIGGAGSIDVPAGFIAGAVGAGDAFCAGVLYGLHEGWPISRCVELANASAIAALSAPGATEGLRPIGEVWKLAQCHPVSPSPLDLD